MKFPSIPTFLLFSVASSMNCVASLVLSNLQGDIFSGGDQITNLDWRAFEFNGGSTSIDLETIEARFTENAGQLSAWVYSDDPVSNVPAEIVGTLDQGGISGPLSSSSTIALSGGVDYWFVVGGASVDADFEWLMSDTNSFISPSSPEGFMGFGSEISQAISSDGGTSWTNIGAGAGWYSIEVLAVPEPSNLVLAFLGFFGVFLKRTRRCC